MKANERERRDWLIIPIILLIGFACVILAGQLAVRFAPSWKLDANMESNLDPNSDFLTNRPNGFIEPVDPSVLTAPVWINVFLTPGASFVTATPFPKTTVTSPAEEPTTISPATVTNTVVITPSPTNTIVNFLPPSSSTPRPNPTNVPVATATDTSTPTNPAPPVADLQITQNDGASTYVPGGTLTYTVTVINTGPSSILGAVIIDNIPTQFTDWNWVCTSQSGGAAGCDAMSGSTNFSDTVDLPSGASITYNVTANISSGASGDLINTASVSLSVGFTDPSPGNNAATDTDQLLTSSPFPNGEIGTIKDTSTSIIPPGSTVTLTFDTPLMVGGHAGYDLVYYELPMGIGIQMDHVILQVSDGYNWYTILNWGDNVGDANTNLDINVIGGSETDNRDTDASLLYDSTGVAIELDGVVPNGTYPYIRIISPVGEDGDGCEVDAIVILP